MLHTKIEDDEIIERYVRNRLAPEDRLSFEEHYFTCDECFERVQAMERFIAGVQDMARHGELDDAAKSAIWPRASKWPLWAFAAASLACVVLAAILVFLSVNRIPALQRRLSAANATIRSEQQELAQRQMSPPSTPGPEANVPLVMLQALRGDEAAEAVVPVDAKRVVLWVEIGHTRYRSYSMEISSASGEPVAAIENLTRGPYGAIAASLPSDRLQPGVFRITLTGQAPPPASLVSEYRLRVHRP